MEIIKPTIVVFGCTGTVGLQVMHILSNKNCCVRGILRSPDRKYPIPLNKNFSNVSYMGVDLNNYEQIKQACIKADAVFLLTATHPTQVEAEIRIINAAKGSGVKRIVKLSAPVVDPPLKVEVSEWHRTVEQYLATSGLDYCCIRPHSFMQNWERNRFTIQYFGIIYGSLGDALRNYVDCRDVAEIAVIKLLSDGPLNEELIPVSGPESVTNKDFAERLSYVTNRKISYVNMAPDEFFKMLRKKARLPQWLASHIVELDNLAIHTTEPNDDTVEMILNRKPRILNTYLQESRHLFGKECILKALVRR